MKIIACSCFMFDLSICDEYFNRGLKMSEGCLVNALHFSSSCSILLDGMYLYMYFAFSSEM